jgi:hypothetical protein
MTSQMTKVHGFLQVGKPLIERFGGECALILSNLIDKDKYWKKKKPNNKGWFYIPHKDQAEQCGMTEYIIIKTKNKLKGLGIIRTEMRKSKPQKEWYLIDYVRLDEVLNPPKNAGYKQYPLNSGGIKIPAETDRNGTTPKVDCDFLIPLNLGGTLIKINKENLMEQRQAAPRKIVRKRTKILPSMRICAFGHRFSWDTEKYHDCDECKLFDYCLDEKEGRYIRPIN